ncbi:hypothetical protein QJS10_CPB11g01686 [Acorus calamus]|uniref:Uncharacterized protein n=1 Tax=Acorus calamus TaxID=4465 RepID=A0AAV9DS08_ACOCL|nr:hypothetical protein QJS10_CPB11g01686 [Acorus calamus]
MEVSLAPTRMSMAPKSRVPQTTSHQRRQSQRLASDVPSGSIIEFVEQEAVEEEVNEPEVVFL